MFTLASCNLLGKDKNTKNKCSLEIEKDSFCKDNIDSVKALEVKKTGTLNDYIIPNSDTKKITFEILDSLDNSQLDYARNEIYARRGYIFKIKKYEEYFLKKWWYVRDEDFSENIFNETERENLKIIDNYVDSISKLVKEINDNYIKCDLNGDKKNDITTLAFKESGKTFILNINGTAIKQSGENFRNTMFLYDIDKNDKFLEVAVVDETAEGKEKYTSFYSYNGSSIKFIGKIPGADDYIKIRGNGKLETKENSKVLFGLTHNVLYNLNLQSAQLIRKPTTFYKINSKVKLKENIIIQATRLNQNNPIELKKGEVVTLVESDDLEWVSIAYAEKEIGWLKFEEANKINQKDSQDVLEKVEE